MEKRDEVRKDLVYFMCKILCQKSEVIHNIVSLLENRKSNW